MALEPPDLNQCQTLITTYHPWVMGGHVYQTERCPNKPHWLVIEVVPDKDGLMGSMTMCDHCATKFIEKQQMPPENYTMELIPNHL